MRRMSQMGRTRDVCVDWDAGTSLTEYNRDTGRMEMWRGAHTIAGPSTRQSGAEVGSNSTDKGPLACTLIL